MLRRGADLQALVADQKHLTFYGRTVGVASLEQGSHETLYRLARLQGNSSIADMPDSAVAPLADAVARDGFKPVHYARWETDTSEIDALMALAQKAKLPAPYRLAWLTPESPTSLCAALGETALDCGVLPPQIPTLTGAYQPGACAMAVTPEGRVASCAAAASYLHPDHPQGRTVCWWGMLATAQDHRGRGLSLSLSAWVMHRMHDVFGFTRFFTGVEPGNSASEAICRKMRLAHRGRSILGIADPSLLASGRMTK